MNRRETDRAHMARCLELAERHRGRTSPNPIVGSVIVAPDGKVLAEGAHRGPGTDHAEIAALKRLPDRAAARGATLYCNLEPCNHHGRTPPCAPVVRDAGLARVVIGVADPIAGHGGGIALLRRAKVAVSVNVLADECRAANRPFFTWAESSRPAFTLKAAITLDGKICTVSGQSKWITGESARNDVMRLRDTHDAVMVGIGTVLADDPRLTARLPKGRDPIRIVIDGSLRTPLTAKLLPKRKRTPRTILVAREDAPRARETALVTRGAEIWRLPTEPNSSSLDLGALATRLAREGITSVLVEGGGQLHASLLAHHLADELVLYVAPTIVGGPAKSWVGGSGVTNLADAHHFVFDAAPTQLGPDLRLHAVRSG